MALSANQTAELAKPLDKSHVAERTQSGRKLSYIEGWHAIAEANRIFGFDGWQRETIEMREVRTPEFIESSNGKKTWRVGFICKVRVTVGSIVREGTGYGSGALPELGEAYESAVKEAETDAMKRALMTFGNPFGLALYDKKQASVVDTEAVEKADAAALVTKFAGRIRGAKKIEELKAIRADMDNTPADDLSDALFNRLAEQLDLRAEELARPSNGVRPKVAPNFDDMPFEQREHA